MHLDTASIIPSGAPRRLPVLALLCAVLTLALATSSATAREIARLGIEERAELVRQTAEWVKTERDARRPEAVPLTAEELELFRPFFPTEVLESARVLRVETIPSPEFVGELRHKGRKVLDLRGALGLALGDTILIRASFASPGSSRWKSVLFHELVHLVQYDALGVDDFIERYFESMAAVDYQYPDIVFEAQAFELQRDFTRQPGKPFSVDDEVDTLVDELPEPPP